MRSRRIITSNELSEDILLAEANLICLGIDCLSAHDAYVISHGPSLFYFILFYSFHEISLG